MKLWYIFDQESMILNEGEGTENINEAVESFKNHFETEEAAKGFTLCQVEEITEDGVWIECINEMTAHEVFNF